MVTVEVSRGSGRGNRRGRVNGRGRVGSSGDKEHIARAGECAREGCFDSWHIRRPNNKSCSITK